MLAQAISRTMPVTVIRKCERGFCFAMDRALSARAALDFDRLGLELRHRLIAHALLQRRFDVGDNRLVEAVQRNARPVRS